MMGVGDIVEVCAMPSMIGVVRTLYPRSLEVLMDKGVLMECSYEYVHVVVRNPYNWADSDGD